MRFFHLLVAVLVAWLGFAPAVAASPLPDSTTAAYTYDASGDVSPPIRTATERGPPTAGDQDGIYNAADPVWRSAEACPDGPTPFAATTYNDAVWLAQVAQVTGTAQEQARRSGGESSSLAQTGVAAKTLPEVKPNATVRDLLDIAPGNAREPLKSGLASRRTDQELLDSVMRPRDGTYMTVSRDGALLEGNHRRFELLDRVHDPRSIIDWDTSIFLDGWPW